jgi:hypothetical protein
VRAWSFRERDFELRLFVFFRQDQPVDIRTVLNDPAEVIAIVPAPVRVNAEMVAALEVFNADLRVDFVGAIRLAGQIGLHGLRKSDRTQ